MKNILKRLFCNHKWILDRKVNDQGLWQCYCENCNKIDIKSTKGDIEH
jgi:hypothetical protein